MRVFKRESKLIVHEWLAKLGKEAKYVVETEAVRYMSFAVSNKKVKARIRKGCMESQRPPPPLSPLNAFPAVNSFSLM